MRPPASIAYRLPVPSRVRVEIHDIAGRRVRALKNTLEPAGERVISWDGRDNRQLAMAAGAYFVKVIATPTDGSTPSIIMHRKVVLVR